MASVPKPHSGSGSGRDGAPKPASRWTPANVAVVVLALAVALVPRLYSRWLGQKAAPSDIRTYCYQGMTTLADDEGSDDAARAKAAARCFTVAGGRFTRVFAPSEDEAQILPSLTGYVIPGLWDGHGHLIAYGEYLASVDLFGASDATDVRHRVGNYVAAHPDAGTADRWLRGFGWDQMAMGGMPTADLLESEALKGLYIMLDRVDGHCIWVSQAVLDLLPFADLPETIPGGEIVRDPGPGVFCDNAMSVVLDKWPKPGRDVKAGYIRRAMEQLRSVGLVGMHDAGVVPDDLRLYQELAGDRAASGWTLRVYAMLECRDRNTFCPEDAAPLRQQETQDDFLAIRSVKLFADGALGSWGSAMLEPYSDRPDTAGSLLVNASALASLTRDWSAAGFQVCIHAIGDAANRYAVDALEQALVACCDQPVAGPLAECQRDRFRFRIEHAQIVHPRDQARVHALGLLPSVQPTHATSDMAYAARRLGPARTRDEAYRMRSFLHDRDAHHHDPKHLVLGSDFPIEPPDPFQGLYAAVARRSPHTGKGADGVSEEPWYPAEALTLDEALAGFTQGPAYGAFLDGRAGVIRDGALADWLVLDKPLHDYDIEDLRSMKVRETWVGGQRVYKRE